MKAIIIMTGFILSWLVSPESLAIIGRGVGLSGRMILVPLAAATALAVLCTALIHGRRSRDHNNDFTLLSLTYGRTSAAAMTLTGRVPVLLFASTAMLVSAGFTFNEIFVHRFPNFLFASLLLTVICGLHLFHERAALWGQAVFTGIALLGLFILMAMGMGQGGKDMAQALPSPSLPWSLFGTVFLLFLGFDFYPPEKQKLPALFIVPGLAFVLLSGWALTAVGHVSPTRLINTSLPHLLVARAIGGDSGSYVMGAVIISGALSGVNMFLLALRRTLADLAGNGFFPEILSKGRFAAIPAFTLIQTMMMTGVAGNDRIDEMVRASLLLWMIYVGFRCFAAGFPGRRFSSFDRLYGSAVAGVIFFLAGSLIMADGRPGYILGFQACVICFFLIILFMWTKTYGRFHPIKNRRNEQ